MFVFSKTCGPVHDPASLVEQSFSCVNIVNVHVRAGDLFVIAKMPFENRAIGFGSLPGKNFPDDFLLVYGFGQSSSYAHVFQRRGIGGFVDKHGLVLGEREQELLQPAPRFDKQIAIKRDIAQS